MEHGRVCMAADNLFHRCRGRSAVNWRTADPVEQLGVIGDYVHDLDKIVKQHGRGNPGCWTRRRLEGTVLMYSLI